MEMDDTMPQDARPEEKTTGRWQKFAIGVLVVLALAIAVPAFVEIYRTATTLVRPYFGMYSWVLPVSLEVCFAFLFILGILLAAQHKPGGALRALSSFLLVALSITVQVYAGRGAFVDALAHLIVVLAFFIVMLCAKQAIMLWRGGKVRLDRVSFGECIAHPWRSISLLWWMTSWNEPSKQIALRRRRALLYARTLAKADERIGRNPFTWKRHLPDTLADDLHNGVFAEEVQAAIDTGESTWRSQLKKHVRRELGLLNPDLDEDTEEDSAPEVPPVTLESILEDSAPEALEHMFRAMLRSTAPDTLEYMLRSMLESSDPDALRDMFRDIVGNTAEDDRAEDDDEDNGGGEDRSHWPLAKSIDRQVLIRRTVTEIDKWHAGGENRNLPALRLDALLEVRMNRTTAKKLIDEAYASRDTRGQAAAR